MARSSTAEFSVLWLALLAVVAAGLGSLAQSPPPSPLASPLPSPDDPAVALVTSGQELADALANPNKTWALLNTSIQVNDSDWAAYSVPVARTTNFTISGQPGPSTSWPILGLGFVKGKIRLDGAAALILQYVVVRDFRTTPLGQSPGFDLVASSATDAGALVLMEDAVLMLRICVPRNIQGEIMSSIVPPAASLPGTQISISNVSQAGCTNNTAAPPVSRCWPDLGVYEDVAVAGFDIDAFGRATATHYTLYMLHVPYLCEKQMTEDCVAQLGPLGCFLYMFPRTPVSTPPGVSPSPSPVAPMPPPVVHKTSVLPAAVGGAVGGGFAAALAGLAAALLVRRRRRRRQEQEEQQKRERYLEQAEAGSGKDSAPPRQANGNGNCTPAGSGAGGGAVGSPPASTGGPPSGVTNGRLVSSSPHGGSLQQNQHSNGRGVRLPSGVGACVLSSQGDVDASNPLVIVTPLTPHRSDLKLDVQCDTEVKLLPIIRGKGSYGRVVEGLYGGERVAVKLVVDVDEWSGPTESLVSSFAQEVEVLGRCQHPNIVRLLAACLKPPRLCLVMELMDTSLERLVHSKPGELLPLPTVLHIAADIARGLAYLHPTIVHRDLKPGNVLLSNTDCPRPIAKLTDFGLSRLRSTVLVTRHPEAGTPAYMAPEAFDASNYVITHKADIYALGVILWEMLTGCVPWDGCSMVAIAYSITVRHHRLPLSKLDAARCPPKLRKLIHQCWDPDPQRRPAAAELVKQLTLVLQLVQGDLEAPVSSGSGNGSSYRGKGSGGPGAVNADSGAAVKGKRSSKGLAVGSGSAGLGGSGAAQSAGAAGPGAAAPAAAGAVPVAANGGAAGSGGGRVGGSGTGGGGVATDGSSLSSARAGGSETGQFPTSHGSQSAGRGLLGSRGSGAPQSGAAASASASAYNSGVNETGKRGIASSGAALVSQSEA